MDLVSNNQQSLICHETKAINQCIYQSIYLSIYLILIILLEIELSWPEKPAHTFAQRTEILDICFEPLTPISKSIQIGQTRHAENFWRSKNEFIRAFTNGPLHKDEKVLDD